jgi:hypothetical protein
MVMVILYTYIISYKVHGLHIYFQACFKISQFSKDKYCGMSTFDSKLRWGSAATLFIIVGMALKHVNRFHSVVCLMRCA